MFGGVSDYSFNLSRSFAEMGNEVKVITSDNENVNFSVPDKVEVLTVGSKWGIGEVNSILDILSVYKPDVVSLQYVPYMYSQIGVPYSLIYLSFMLWLKNIMLITTFHEVARKLDFRHPKYFMVSISQRLIAYALCLFSKFAVISLDRYRNMLFMFRGKIVRIPIGSSILPVKISKNEKSVLRNELAPENEFVIATFGSTSRRIDLLIQSMKIMINRGSKIKFVILGKLPNDVTQRLNNVLNELNLHKHVCLKGFLESEDVYRCLSVSDMFVMIEGIDDYGYVGVNSKSTALAAGYAAGLPIVGVKGHMTDDFFKHNENVYFINSKDEKTIAEELENIINNFQILKNLKDGSESTYKNYLSWDLIGERYNSLFVS